MKLGNYKTLEDFAIEFSKYTYGNNIITNEQVEDTFEITNEANGTYTIEGLK
jgi:hypothetical protein